MRVPSSTPAGIATLSDFSLRVRPEPPQLPQGVLMVCPAPLQVGQVRSTVKNPCCARTRPAPRQVSQVSALVPFSAPDPLQGAQPCHVDTLIGASLPVKESSSVISISYDR